MKIEDLFVPDSLFIGTESDYRSTGIHYSDLQSIANGEYDRLNPEKKAEAQEELNNNPSIIAGNGFELCIKDPNQFRDLYRVKEFVKPGYTEALLVDVILEQNVSLTDVDTIHQIIIDNGFWKSSSAKEKLRIASELSTAIKGYVNQERMTYPEGAKFISSDTKNGIFTAAVAAKERFEEEGWLYFYDVSLKFEQYVVRIDLLKVNPKTKLVQIIDFKFKFEKPAETFYSSYFKYNYWIQPVLYNKVLTECLDENYSLDDNFYYIVGSNAMPEIVDYFSVNVSLLPEGGYFFNPYSEPIKSIKSLEKELNLRRAMNEWKRKYIMFNLKEARIQL